MRILLNYEWLGRIFPGVVSPTDVYFDTRNSTFCISNGDYEWELPIDEQRAYEVLDELFNRGRVYFAPHEVFKCTEV